VGILHSVDGSGSMSELVAVGGEIAAPLPATAPIAHEETGFVVTFRDYWRWVLRWRRESRPSLLDAIARWAPDAEVAGAASVPGQEH
jgi:hypothetical protein